MDKQTGSKDLFYVGGKDFKVRFEYTPDLFIIHLPEIKISKSSLKELSDLIDNWSEFLKVTNYAGFHAAIPHTNRVICKLATRLGFVFITHNKGYNIFFKGV